MRLSYLLTGSLLGVSIAFNVFAAAPIDVSGLRAEIQDDTGTIIQWDTVPGDIAYYRVYYSSSSILENQGKYDDFEQTDDSTPKHIFGAELLGADLYVAIMAVNTSGEESEFFSEEILVSAAENLIAPEEPLLLPDIDLPPEPELFLPEQEPAADILQPELLELISVESVSPREVRLVFSEGLKIRSKDARSAFVIQKTGGEQLEILGVSIEGATALLSTDSQKEGVVYELRLTNDLVKQTSLVVDDASRVSLFSGYKNEEVIEAPETIDALTGEDPVALTPDGIIQNIRGLVLATAANANGRYDVTAEWDSSSVDSEAAFLVVGQSFDGGRTVSNPNLIPSNAINIQTQDVPAGLFGLFIQTMDVQGHLSSGVFESVVLGDSAIAPAPFAPAPSTNKELATIAPTPYPQPQTPSQGPQKLPQSGSTMLLFVLTTVGGLLGWKKMGGMKAKRA